MVVATVFVGLRVYARFFKAKVYGLDDYLVLAAWVPAVGLSATIWLAINKYQWNRHIWDVDPGPHGENLISERAISWACQMLYMLSSSLTKLSLLVFYKRIISRGRVTMVLNCFIALTTAYLVTFVLALLLECRPLAHYWYILVEPEGTGGTCADESALLLVSGVMNCLLDTAILVIPIPTVWKLNINFRQKCQVSSIFATGIFVLGSSAIRISATLATTALSYDVTWDGYLVFMWIGIEVDVGLMCASLPALSSLVKGWRAESKTRSSRARSESTPSRSSRFFRRSKSALSSQASGNMAIQTIGGSYVMVSGPNSQSQWVLRENPGRNNILVSKEVHIYDEEMELDYLDEVTLPSTVYTGGRQSLHREAFRGSQDVSWIKDSSSELLYHAK